MRNTYAYFYIPIWDSREDPCQPSKKCLCSSGPETSSAWSQHQGDLHPRLQSTLANSSPCPSRNFCCTYPLASSSHTLQRLRLQRLCSYICSNHNYHSWSRNALSQLLLHPFRR